MKTSPSRWMGAALAAAVLAACGGPGTPPPPDAPPPDAAAPTQQAGGARAANPADVRFMHGMIAHHAQAVEMTRLVPERTRREDVRLLAERIAVSQRDEIALIQRWLRRHGAEAPAADGHHHAHMAGMLTPEELARLGQASGADFDRLFLELMIRHHEGALRMVAELFASPGAAQDPEVFRLASDVGADQRAEIARMRRMLEGPLHAAPRP